MITKTGQVSFQNQQKPPKFSGRFSGVMADKTRLATYMGILMPNVLVAPIRYVAMRETPEVKYRLFLRDVLAAAAGVISFYATRGASNAILKRTIMKAKPAVDRDLLGTFLGWTANVIVQGWWAVRMSENMSKRQQEKLGHKSSVAGSTASGQLATPVHPDPQPIPPPAFRPSPPLVETPPSFAPPSLPPLPAPSLENQRYFRNPQFVPQIPQMTSLQAPVFNPFGPPQYQS